MTIFYKFTADSQSAFGKCVGETFWQLVRLSQSHWPIFRVFFCATLYIGYKGYYNKL